nr:MAG TPA: hypothetical protein [Caudoviricetes sp.]
MVLKKNYFAERILKPSMISKVQIMNISVVRT